MLAAALKLSTQPSHERVEGSAAMRHLMEASLTAEAYGEHLRALHAFYVPLYACLAEAEGLASWLPDLPERLGAPRLLAADLGAFGLAPAPPASPEALPSVRTLADAFGVLYVAEGASLGGALIARHLGRTLGVSPEWGAAYYGRYGDRRGPLWQAFRASLDQFGTERPDARADVHTAAARTFEALDLWMQAPSP